MTKKTLAVLVFAVAGAGVARAEMPKEIKDMSCLVGNWKGTGSMSMGGKSVNVGLTWACKRTSGEWGVGCAGGFTGVPGLDRYEETDLFGFDPGAGKYHWFAVTNGGETHDHVALPPKGDTIEFVYEGVQDGKPMKEVIHMTFKGKDSSQMELNAETFIDGKSASVLKASAHK